MADNFIPDPATSTAHADFIPDPAPAQSSARFIPDPPTHLSASTFIPDPTPGDKGAQPPSAPQLTPAPSLPDDLANYIRPNPIQTAKIPQQPQTVGYKAPKESLHTESIPDELGEGVGSVGSDIANDVSGIGSTIHNQGLVAGENILRLATGDPIARAVTGHGTVGPKVAASFREDEKRTANEAAESFGKVQNPGLKFAGEQAVPLGSMFIPGAGPAVAAAVSAQNTQQSVRNELEKSGASLDESYDKSLAPALASGVTAYGATKLPVGKFAGGFPQAAVTTGALDLTNQIAEHLVTGKPLDWKQVGGAAAFGTILHGGFQALHSIFGGRVPAEAQQKLAEAKTPEQVEQVVNEARTGAPVASNPSAEPRTASPNGGASSSALPQPTEAPPAPEPQKTQEATNASTRNPAQAGAMESGADVAKPGGVVAEGVPPVVEGQGAPAGDQPRDVDAVKESSLPPPAERALPPAGVQSSPVEAGPPETKPIRFEAGKKLTPEQKKQVLQSVRDVYRDNGLKRDELKGYHPQSGDPYYGYPVRPDLFIRSDVTGAKVRHYVVLPDGTKAHPTELFPNIKQSEIDRAMGEQIAKEKMASQTAKEKDARIASGKSEANAKYNQTLRPLEGSYFVQDDSGRIARVDGSDPEDVSHFEEQGFKRITSPVASPAAEPIQSSPEGEAALPSAEPPAASANKSDAGAGGRIFGEGPSTPAINSPEFTPEGRTETPTSAKNRIATVEAAKRGVAVPGQPEVRHQSEEFERALQTHKDQPTRADELIKELNDKPRAVSEHEQHLIAIRTTELENEYDALNNRIVKRFEEHGAEPANEEERASAIADRIRWSALQDQMAEAHNAMKQSGGTETARALAARKLEFNRDFSIARMTTEKRAALGGRPLTPDEATDIKRLHDRIAELEKKLEEREGKADETGAKVRVIQATKEMEQEVAKENAADRKNGKPRDRKAEKEAILKGLKDRVADGAKASDLGPLIQRLARNFVAQGVREREALVDAVYGEIKDIVPNITRRETMDAISGYGDYKQLSKDEVSVALRDLKGQMQQVGKLQDMTEKNQAPLKTGVERRVPSDEERRLIQQVNETKKRLNIQTTDPETQLKSALQSKETALTNRIKDLKYEIETKQRIVKDKAPSPENDKIKALRAELEELQKQHKEIFGEPQTTMEQKLKAATDAARRSEEMWQKRLADAKKGTFFGGKILGPRVSSEELRAIEARRDAVREEVQHLQDLANPKKTPEEIALQAFKTRTTNRIAELQEKIANGDYAKTPRREVKLDQTAFAMKAQLERYKRVFQEGLIRDQLKNRSAAEKGMDYFTKWRRANLLSGPSTLLKLTSAAVQRLAFTPIEEGVGAGLGRIIPKLAKAAPREGGFSLRAEAKAFTGAFMKGVGDAIKTGKTGESDLSLNYGKPNLQPHSIADLFGQLHGALKAPVKRAEFERSLQKRSEWAMRNGYDVTEPMTQLRLAKEAFEDAERSIFMQNNRLVNYWRAKDKIIPAPDPTTGKPKLLNKMGTTAANVAVPIVKIPTNYVAESFQYAFGSVTGGARLAGAVARGLDNLKPEEADQIMRSLKKGSVGAALLALGYFNSENVGGYYQPGQHRDDKDVKAGGLRVFGVKLPPILLHSPAMECLQFGATIRRVSDSYLDRKHLDKQGTASGVFAAALGLTEEVPFVKQTVDIGKLFDPKEREGYLSQYARDLFVPQGSSQAAQFFDKDAQGNPIKRKPEGVIESIKTGIPGLRQQVPAASEASAAMQQRKQDDDVIFRSLSRDARELLNEKNELDSLGKLRTEEQRYRWQTLRGIDSYYQQLLKAKKSGNEEAVDDARKYLEEEAKNLKGTSVLQPQGQ
jgi:hypothetical protein